MDLTTFKIKAKKEVLQDNPYIKNERTHCLEISYLLEEGGFLFELITRTLTIQHKDLHTRQWGIKKHKGKKFRLNGKGVCKRKFLITLKELKN